MSNSGELFCVVQGSFWSFCMFRSDEGFVVHCNSPLPGHRTGGVILFSFTHPLNSLMDSFYRSGTRRLIARQLLHCMALGTGFSVVEQGEINPGGSDE